MNGNNKDSSQTKADDKLDHQEDVEANHSQLTEEDRILRRAMLDEEKKDRT